MLRMSDVRIDVRKFQVKKKTLRSPPHRVSSRKRKEEEEEEEDEEDEEKLLPPPPRKIITIFDRPRIMLWINIALLVFSVLLTGLQLVSLNHFSAHVLPITGPVTLIPQTNIASYQVCCVFTHGLQCLNNNETSIDLATRTLRVQGILGTQCHFVWWPKK